MYPCPIDNYSTLYCLEGWHKALMFPIEKISASMIFLKGNTYVSLNCRSQFLRQGALIENSLKDMGADH